MHCLTCIALSERCKQLAKDEETCNRFVFGCGESFSPMSPYAQLTIRKKAIAVVLAKEGIF